VDTGAAGEGQLVVHVSRDGQRIPAQITVEQPGRYHVSFMPEAAGNHVIRLYFAGVEVNGKQRSLISSCYETVHVKDARPADKMQFKKCLQIWMY